MTHVTNSVSYIGILGSCIIINTGFAYNMLFFGCGRKKGKTSKTCDNEFFFYEIFNKG